MRARWILCAVLLFGTPTSRAWCELETANAGGDDRPPPWARRPPAESVATVSLGLFAAYVPYEFPRSNEWLSYIVEDIPKPLYITDLGDLASDLGLMGYAQVLIWEGWGLRLSLQYVKAKPPEAFGVVRADVGAKTSPVNLSYSLVKEIPFRRVRVAVGAGIDQYRWSMHWKFSEIGEEPIEDYKWTGRGTGGHGFLEVGGTLHGLELLVGTAYHRGVYEMNLEELPPTTEIDFYPRRFEEDVNSLQFYGGMTLTIF